tara:strand:- start:528 stop:932 length:405 start_codon:yes stop_codon:yes gene_type:complete
MEGTLGACTAELAMSEEFIPIVMFLVLGAVAGLALYFKSRARTEMQKTVRVALEKGQELSSELVAQLGENRRSSEADLRRGLIYLAVAFGLAAFGYLVDEEDVPQKMLAISMLPFFISIAYLALWQLGKSRERH